MTSEQFEKFEVLKLQRAYDAAFRAYKVNWSRAFRAYKRATFSRSFDAAAAQTASRAWTLAMRYYSQESLSQAYCPLPPDPFAS